MRLLARWSVGSRSTTLAAARVARAQRDHHRLAEEAKALLTERACCNDSLESLAHVLHISAFHLARVFRERTGFSLHAYRTHLRLRLALERLSGAGTDLGWMARELGFSSHAHFTGVFNSVFGEPPSAVEPEGVTTSRLTTVT